MLYIESSAVAKLVVPESGTTELEGFLGNRRPQTSSVLTRIEVSRIITRRPSAPPDLWANLADALSVIDLLPIDEPIVALACRIDPPGLRSLDAIHLASALTLENDLEGIVTYDRRLADAGRQLGIPIFSPGSDN